MCFIGLFNSRVPLFVRQEIILNICTSYNLKSSFPHLKKAEESISLKISQLLNYYRSQRPSLRSASFFNSLDKIFFA